MWLDEWVPKLKKEDPDEVLGALRHLPAPTPEAAKVRGTALRYLRSRRPFPCKWAVRAV